MTRRWTCKVFGKRERCCGPPGQYSSSAMPLGVHAQLNGIRTRFRGTNIAPARACPHPERCIFWKMESAMLFPGLQTRGGLPRIPLLRRGRRPVEIGNRRPSSCCRCRKMTRRRLRRAERKSRGTEAILPGVIRPYCEGARGICRACVRSRVTSPSEQRDFVRPNIRGFRWSQNCLPAAWTSPRGSGSD